MNKEIAQKDNAGAGMTEAVLVKAVKGEPRVLFEIEMLDGPLWHQADCQAVSKPSIKSLRSGANQYT